jgi:hypothetical protein
MPLQIRPYTERPMAPLHILHIVEVAAAASTGRPVTRETSAAFFNGYRVLPRREPGRRLPSSDQSAKNAEQGDLQIFAPREDV